MPSLCKGLDQVSVSSLRNSQHYPYRSVERVEDLLSLNTEQVPQLAACIRGVVDFIEFKPCLRVTKSKFFVEFTILLNVHGTLDFHIMFDGFLVVLEEVAQVLSFCSKRQYHLI